MSTSDQDPADTMRALCLSEPGGPDGIAEARLPVPVPGTGDVLLRVHGASYTPGELEWPSTWVDRSGHDRTPVVPGHEVSGVVVALGWGTSGFAVGDEVYGLTDWYRDGAMAEYMAVEARSLAPKPVRLGHDAAATIPMPGLTAWEGLFRHGQLEAGETVLVLGAAGGVGALAVQLARHAGARVLGLGRAKDADVIARLGADVILSADGDLGSERARLVFDTIGGTALEHAWDVLEEGGKVISIAEQPSPERLAARQASGSYFVVEPDRVGLRELAARIDAGTLDPTIGITCSLDDGRETIITKERGGVPGKIALSL